MAIPIKNTYIDLEVQEFTYHRGGGEEYMEHGLQHKEALNRTSSSQAYNKGINDKRDQRNRQQRRDTQDPRIEQSGYQQEKISRSGIDSMLPLPTPLNITDVNVNTSVVETSAGVVVGGLDGSGQEKDSITQSRLSIGKGKIGEQGYLNDNVPPDKINFNQFQQMSNKKNTSNVSNPGNDPNIHQRDRKSVV